MKENRKIVLNENIRLHRKRMKLTQEQLAEAMNVTVGAVSKWESGQSNPEISLLPELADLFGVSVDVLLGYQMYTKHPDHLAEELYQMMQRREYEKGELEAEKAIKKYPNHFLVIYRSADLFYMSGVEYEGEERKMRRALELYRHACTLISQNTLEEVSELSLQGRIGEIYYWLGEKEQALEQLKKYNACGINDSMLGVIYAQSGEYKEAFHYLSRNMLESIGELLRTVNSMALCYYRNDETRTAYEMFEWMYGMIHQLRSEEKISYADKIEVMMLCGSAQMLAALEEWEKAEGCLRQAKVLAERFDAEPNYDAEAIRFYKGKQVALGDDFGEKAMQGIDKNILESDTPQELKELWKRIRNEA